MNHKMKNIRSMYNFNNLKKAVDKQETTLADNESNLNIGGTKIERYPK